VTEDYDGTGSYWTGDDVVDEDDDYQTCDHTAVTVFTLCLLAAGATAAKRKRIEENKQ
jgi:hypothetical protein